MLAGAVPRVVETTAASGFRMSPAQLEAAIGPRTVAVILNSPSNPTGAAYGADELRALGEVALRREPRRHHRRHLRAADGRARCRTSARSCPALRPRLVVINSVSKTYAMTGWRIGYTAAPVELIRAMTVLQSQSTSNPTSIAQAAAAAALDRAAGVRRPRWRASSRRAASSSCTPPAQIPGVRTTVPEGRLLRLPGRRARSSGADGRRASRSRRRRTLAMYLLRHAGVASVPGEGFGAPAHIRLSYAASRDRRSRRGSRRSPRRSRALSLTRGQKQKRRRRRPRLFFGQ